MRRLECARTPPSLLIHNIPSDPGAHPPGQNADGAIDRYNQPRQSISDIHGVVDLDVHDGPGGFDHRADDPGGYDRAHPSIRRRSAEPGEDADGYRSVGDEPVGTGPPMELPTLPMVEREGYVRSGGASARHGTSASVRSAGAAAVPTEKIEPIYSESTKKSVRRKDSNAAAVKPVLSDGDMDAAVPTTTWFTQPDIYSEIVDVVPVAGGGGDDEVEAALNGLRTSIKKGAFSPAEPGADLKSPISPDYSRQASKSSIVIPDGEHPFLDDLNGDFSNPLFRS